MKVYVGMDVHRKRSRSPWLMRPATRSATATSPTIRPSGADPWHVAAGHPGGLGGRYGGGWLVGLLEELELEPHLVHPAAARRSPSARLKNDKVDARTLASCCGPSCCPRPGSRPQATRELRVLLRHRASLVGRSTWLKHRGHAVLADRGIGEDQILWTGRGRAWLASLELPAIPRAIVEDGWGCWTPWPPIARLERAIGALAKPDPGSRRFRSCPGRPADRDDLVAEIGDIDRFPTARKRCAWPGCPRWWATPTARSATATAPSRLGVVRWIRQQAAQTANKRPMVAGADGQLARRRGTQIATVAIARRLLARWFHLLKEVQTATTGEGQTGRAPTNRLRRQHGRPA